MAGTPLQRARVLSLLGEGTKIDQALIGPTFTNLFLCQEVSATTPHLKTHLFWSRRSGEGRAHGYQTSCEELWFFLKITSPYSLPNQPVTCVHSSTDVGGPDALRSPDRS